MLKRLGLVVTMVAVGVATASAGERPLFEFKGEVPAPGGTARLEARCDKGTEGVRCRVGGRGPSGEGFQFEGSFLSLPREFPSSGQAETPRNAPRWF